ncbi:MAG: NAD-dependent epimerase/dehydratase family protein [Bacteroidetes bacterium]|nr:NAD-dependent epimerase/dehydratase family protein [Bacteroidota bacterium]
MKVCVTGGAGMIGSSLVKKLCESGYEVQVIDNLWRGSKSYLEQINGWSLDLNFHHIDLADPGSLSRVTKIFSSCEVVIHLADIVAGIGYVFNHQYEIFKVNNHINSLVFEACAASRIRKVVYAGTACSFPKQLQNGLTSILREDQLFPAEPESSYGWSKLAGTLELNYLCMNSEMEGVTLMLHNVYGINCDLSPKRSQVIPSLIRRMLELRDGESLTVWGSGRQGRAFVYVDDIVNAFLKAIEKDNLPQIIQIGPDTCTSIRDLAYLLKDEVLCKQIDIFFDETKPEGDAGRCADYSLAKNVLGWSPGVDLKTGLAQTTNWIAQALKSAEV